MALNGLFFSLYYSALPISFARKEGKKERKKEEAAFI